MVPVFVALTVLVFVAIDAWLSRKHERVLHPVPGTAPAMHLPQGRFLHPWHTWACVLPFGRVRIGLDSLLRHLAGPQTAIAPPTCGARLKRGEPLFTLRDGERVMTVPSPLTGVVESVNVEPRQGSADDWLCIVRPSHLSTEIKPYFIGETATAFLRAEWRRAAEWLGSRRFDGAVPALPDGGQPAEGALVHLAAVEWTEFQREFLNNNLLR